VIFAPGGRGYSATPNPDGFGKYGDSWPISWKILWFRPCPTIGTAVSRGAFGTNVTVDPRTGFV
jgi:hypothetical protein